MHVISLVGRRQGLVQDIRSLAQRVQRQLTYTGARTTVDNGPRGWMLFLLLACHPQGQ